MAVRYSISLKNYSVSNDCGVTASTFSKSPKQMAAIPIFYFRG